MMEEEIAQEVRIMEERKIPPEQGSKEEGQREPKGEGRKLKEWQVQEKHGR